MSLKDSVDFTDEAINLRVVLSNSSIVGGTHRNNVLVASIVVRTHFGLYIWNVLAEAWSGVALFNMGDMIDNFRGD